MNGDQLGYLATERNPQAEKGTKFAKLIMFIALHLCSIVREYSAIY